MGSLSFNFNHFHKFWVTHYSDNWSPLPLLYDTELIQVISALVWSNTSLIVYEFVGLVVLVAFTDIPSKPVMCVKPMNSYVKKIDCEE